VVASAHSLPPTVAGELSVARLSAIPDPPGFARELAGFGGVGTQLSAGRVAVALVVPGHGGGGNPVPVRSPAWNPRERLRHPFATGAVENEGCVNLKCGFRQARVCVMAPLGGMVVPGVCRKKPGHPYKAQRGQARKRHCPRKRHNASSLESMYDEVSFGKRPIADARHDRLAQQCPPIQRKARHCRAMPSGVIMQCQAGLGSSQPLSALGRAA
jgi:hypothetical protein